MISGLSDPGAATTFWCEGTRQDQGAGPLNEQPRKSIDDRLIAEETRSDFVALTETEGEITRGKTVGSVTATKTFEPVKDDDDDMPLPTDPKTIFLGGLFGLACMAVLYVAAEVILPVILAIVLKLLLQPFVRLLERVHIPRAMGAVLSVLLVLLVFAARSVFWPAGRHLGRQAARRYRRCATV